jgi:hypothetical protein
VLPAREGHDERVGVLGLDALKGTPPEAAELVAVLEPALVLAAIVSDVGARPPIRREIVPIVDRHVLVFDPVVVFDLVVRPGPPAPHSD